MKPYIVANWKMNLGPDDGPRVAGEIARCARAHLEKVEVGIAPSFPLIPLVAEAIRESGVLLGAQNLFWEDSGAYTGEVSGAQLAGLGVRFVIVGHSERRRIMGEDNETVKKKLLAALRHGLRPILCVGETLEEREAGAAKRVVAEQLAVVQGVEGEIDVAYEPVWAIGTGVNATPEQASEMHLFIKERLGDVRVLYGGSVKAHNAGQLARAPGVDGFLVGGASLRPHEFCAIIEAYLEARR